MQVIDTRIFSLEGLAHQAHVAGCASSATVTILHLRLPICSTKAII